MKKLSFHVTSRHFTFIFHAGHEVGGETGDGGHPFPFLHGIMNYQQPAGL
jgi:hypothetical protein